MIKGLSNFKITFDMLQLINNGNVLHIRGDRDDINFWMCLTQKLLSRAQFGKDERAYDKYIKWWL